MKEIILIGASGFVGSAILNEALNRNHKVTAIARHKARLTTGSGLPLVIKNSLPLVC